MHRRYERTCNVCGGSWVVARSVAGRPPRRSGRAGGAGFAGGLLLAGTAAGLEGAYRVVLDQWALFRRCPTCGHDDFWQQPAPDR